MPVRTGFRDLANRVFNQVSRGTMDKADDSPMWQELIVGSRFGTQYKNVETWHPYGYTSVPPEVKEGEKETPETVLLFPNGSRSNPIALLMGDRRSRPRGLKPGENTQGDDIGQMTLLRRNFLRVLSLDTAAEGAQQAVERFVSLAHVNKQKQPRPKTEGTAEQLQADRQSAENFKHEGDTVNLEVRVNKNKISFLDGDTEVGNYDKQSGEWHFLKKVIFEKDVDFGKNASRYVRVQGDNYMDADPKVRGVPGTVDPD